MIQDFGFVFTEAISSDWRAPAGEHVQHINTSCYQPFQVGRIGVALVGFVLALGVRAHTTERAEIGL